MGIFSRVTQGDLAEVKHAIEILDERYQRMQKQWRSKAAREAGLFKRIKRLEDLFASATPLEGDLNGMPLPVDTEEEEVVEEDDIETRRLRLGRG